MKGVAGLVLSFLDLAEAEGRLLRDNVKRTGLGCGLLALGLCFVGAAFAFLTVAAYEAIATLVPRPAAFLILALVCAFIAMGIMWSAKKCNGTTEKTEQATDQEQEQGEPLPKR